MLTREITDFCYCGNKVRMLYREISIMQTLFDTKSII